MASTSVSYISHDCRLWLAGEFPFSRVFEIILLQRSLQMMLDQIRPYAEPCPKSDLSVSLSPEGQSFECEQYPWLTTFGEGPRPIINIKTWYAARGHPFIGTSLRRGDHVPFFKGFDQWFHSIPLTHNATTLSGIGEVSGTFIWLLVLLKEICPRGNNKVIIYFLISW